MAILMGWRTEARASLRQLAGLAVDARDKAEHARRVAGSTRSRRARRSLLDSARRLDDCATSYDETATDIRAALRRYTP
jgi:hypothetical protein